MKIALLFGSFNPTHNGHLQIAKTVLDKGLAQQVWLVVSPQNPLKNPLELADFNHRLNMANLAVRNFTNIKVSEIEKELPTPSYTINTIEKLKTEYPDNKFFILCGSDIAEQLDRWHRIEELKNMVEFIVYPRGNNNAPYSSVFEGVDLLDTSSTQLRDTLNHSELPSGVYNYIKTNNLYIPHTSLNTNSYTNRHTTESPDELYDKGCAFYANGDFGNAINSFKNALLLDSSYTKASEMLSMVNEILAFRHTDIYNP